MTYLAYLLIFFTSGIINTIVLGAIRILCSIPLMWLPRRILPHISGVIAGFVATVLLSLAQRWIFGVIAGPENYGLAAFLAGLAVPAIQAIQDHSKALHAFVPLEGPDLTPEERESKRAVLAVIKNSGMPTVGSTLLVMVGQLGGALWFWNYWA